MPASLVDFLFVRRWFGIVCARGLIMEVPKQAHLSVAVMQQSVFNSGRQCLAGCPSAAC